MIKQFQKLSFLSALLTLTSFQVARAQYKPPQNPLSIHVLNESQEQIINADQTEKKEIIVAIPLQEKSILSLTIGSPALQLQPGQSTKVIIQQRKGLFNARFGRVGQNYAYGEFESEKFNFYGYYVRDVLNNMIVDYNQYYRLVKIDFDKLSITPIINQNIMFQRASRFALNDLNDPGINIKPSSIGAEVTLKDTRNLNINVIASAGPHFGILKDQPMVISPGFNLKFNILLGSKNRN